MMSLDTVLKIGKALRKADNNLKYFKYVEACPKDKDGNYPLCLTISVKEDFSFDWDKVKVTPEKEREKLFYLKLKTSDQDSSAKKYLFGDIYFKRVIKKDKSGNIKEIKELGNFEVSKTNSFDNALNAKKKKDELPALQFIKNQTSSFNESNFNKWIENFKSVKDKISSLLTNSKALSDDIKTLSRLSSQEIEESNIFLHFDFKGKHWHQLDESKILIDYLNSAVSKESNGRIVLTKSIYRTVCSGNDKNDIQFPFFNLENRYKSFAFKNQEEFLDFLYTDKIVSQPFRKLYGTDITFYIYPVLVDASDAANSISAKDYEDFFFELKDESRLVNKQNDSEKDSFSFFEPMEKTKFTKFDFVFANSSGQTVNELIEISRIEKSKLRDIRKRHEKNAAEVDKERDLRFEENNEYILKPENSFTQILGKAITEENSKTKKPKVVFVNRTKTANGYKPVSNYQSHLLKVLPLIYMENYFYDEMLLPAFIQNVEYSVRANDEKYSFLKFHLMFLLKIQNNKNDHYMEILKSPSYQIGVKLGKLSKPLKKKINAFEKRYVGLLTRHTSTKDDCIKFANDINEMLTRHEKTWGQMSAEVNEELAQLPLKDYDREKLAFGFFEGYFKYEASDKKKDFFSRLEKLLADYEGNEELQETVDQFNELLDQIKTETTTT